MLEPLLPGFAPWLRCTICGLDGSIALGERRRGSLQFLEVQEWKGRVLTAHRDGWAHTVFWP